LISHLIETTDFVRSSKPQAGIILLGDFNHTDIRPLCVGNKLTQVVDLPTREDAILDLIITDFAELYKRPHVSSPIGRSDHNCVSWVPKLSKCVNIKLVKTVRPIKDSNLKECSRWILSQTWSTVYDAKDVQTKADAFYQTVNEGIDNFFPS
jgi:hypothetical protein